MYVKEKTEKKEEEKTTQIYIGERMSQGRILTAYGSLYGRIVWAEMSHGQFVGGHIVSEPNRI